MTVNISKISQNGSGLDVEWNDGEKVILISCGYEIIVQRLGIKIQGTECLIY